MSFEGAKPVNRVTYGRAAEFDLGARQRGGNQASGGRWDESRQSVNISEDTLMRVARAKLSRMVSHRLGYGPQGALASEPTVGSALSTKA